MTLQQLKYFLEIAKTKNFSTAAKNLFVAQSSVSYAIHELEQELKVPLFVRDVNRKVTLTEYGEKYLPYAERIFNLLDEGENELKSMSDPLSGTVRMGFFYCVANSEIPKIFRQFYEDNPNCNIFLDFDVNHGQGSMDEQLLLGKFDLIISAGDEIKNCDRVRIGRQKLKVIVANNHYLADRKLVGLSDLDGIPLIGINPSSSIDGWIREMYRREGLKPDISYCSNWITQFGYVAMNYGIAISPSMPMYKDYIVELELDNPMNWRDLYLHWPQNRKLTKAAEFVRDYIISATDTSELIEG